MSDWIDVLKKEYHGCDWSDHEESSMLGSLKKSTPGMILECNPEISHVCQTIQFYSPNQLRYVRCLAGAPRPSWVRETWSAACCYLNCHSSRQRRDADQMECILPTPLWVTSLPWHVEYINERLPDLNCVELDPLFSMPAVMHHIETANIMMIPPITMLP